MDTKTKCTISNERYFENIDSPEKAYMLGLMLSDGSVGNNNAVSISQCLENIDIVNYFSDQLGFNGYYLLGNRFNSSGKLKTYPTLSFNSKRMVSDLRQYGVIPAKTLKLRIPNVSHMSYMVLGMFDGDGCIHYKPGKKDTIFQLAGTKDSMLDLCNYFNGLNINVRYRRHDTDGNCYIIYCYKKSEIKKIYDLFYQDPTIGFKRKKDIFEQLIHDYDLDESPETRFEYNIDNRHVYNSYILGSILGNGNFLSDTRIKINKGKVNNLDFKIALFDKYLQPSTTNILSDTIYSATFRSKKFKYIYAEMNGKLSQEIINRINEYSLGILYLDKGLLKDSMISITNLKYSKHDNERICSHIKNRYKIEIKYENESYHLDEMNSTKFLDLIKETLILYSNYKTN